MAKKQQKTTTKASKVKLSLGSWLRQHSWKFLLVFAVVLGSYAFYLDASIKKQFSGNKWQVPAQIFARPLQLYQKQHITRKEIVDELQLLGYRKVSKAKSVGEYSVAGRQIDVYRRAFHFSDGYQPQRLVRLQLKDQGQAQRLVGIWDINGRQSLARFRLEPWLVTRLVSSDREDRMLVKLADVPIGLTEALIAIEDRDFYRHHGVAPLAILRALLANISAGRTVQGGSTLTQQLVKNLYLSKEKSIWRKIREAMMAIIIEARYSKEEILEAYLNEVFLGQDGATGVHGFALASYFYFDRPLNELGLAEMSTLVGMIKGPSYYNPKRHPQRTLARRNLVLRVLFEDNFISTREYKALLNSPLGITAGARLASGKHPAFMGKVKRELADVLADPEIRQSGVKVFTTLDINAQRRAERAVRNEVKRIAQRRGIEDLQAAMLVTDIRHGEIRAIIGNRDSQYHGFNRALDAKRAVGSLIKPAIYLTALEQAGSYNLATPLQDVPIKMKSNQGKYWQPKNADKKFRGQVPLIDGLKLSLNVPTVALGMALGLDNVVYTLQRLGIEQPIKAYPAMTLGAVNFSPLQVNQMYQTLSNNGRYIPLHTVNAVMSANDELLWQFDFVEEQRIDEQASYLLNYALHKVTLEGTAKQLSAVFPNINMAGKTGTTDDYRDSWFAGFDKDHLVTAWLGKDDNGSTGLSGASGAMQVFVQYQKLQQPKSLVRRFPQGLGIAHFNLANGKLMAAGCQGSISVPAILDALPKERASCDTGVTVTSRKKTLWERLFGG